MTNPSTRRVLAENSLGREKYMDLEEYTRRAVTDHRVMARTPAQLEEAERLLAAQKKFAESCFNSLYLDQNPVGP